MNSLNEQLTRLFPSASGGMPPMLDLSGSHVRVLVIDIVRGRDWSAAAALIQGLQQDLDLPMPAVSVSPRSGFQIWLPLAEPIAADVAASFLDGLRRRYLGELPKAACQLHPGASASIELVPGRDDASGLWSAFIDPNMGSMFIDEMGLEITPNMDRQADILAAIASLKPAELQRALTMLDGADGGAEEVVPAARPVAAGRLNIGGGFGDPKAFLLAVMNDPSASAQDRIQAACALLPYSTGH